MVIMMIILTKRMLLKFRWIINNFDDHLGIVYNNPHPQNAPSNPSRLTNP